MSVAYPRDRRRQGLGMTNQTVVATVRAVMAYRMSWTTVTTVATGM
jgi:hypothetical protein